MNTNDPHISSKLITVCLVILATNHLFLFLILFLKHCTFKITLWFFSLHNCPGQWEFTSFVSWIRTRHRIYSWHKSKASFLFKGGTGKKLIRKQINAILGWVMSLHNSFTYTYGNEWINTFLSWVKKVAIKWNSHKGKGDYQKTMGGGLDISHLHC